MRCIICDQPTAYFLTKTFTEPPFDVFMRDIGPVHYDRCTACGFVLSGTHAALPAHVWAKLNHDCHHFVEQPVTDGYRGQPPYAEQALMLVLLRARGLIGTERWVDYAAGYGALSRLLARYFDTHLPIFDPYIRDGDPQRYVDALVPGGYDTVINSAMFEHILCRADLDAVNSLVAPHGCLILHTVVCENVPADPAWFYFRPPVHTAFHTNRSMSILMEQWGYRSSLYSPRSKCWVLFKHTPPDAAAVVASLNQELRSDWFFFKDGFVDYWKGF